MVERLQLSQPILSMNYSLSTYIQQTGVIHGVHKIYNITVYVGPQNIQKKSKVLIKVDSSREYTHIKKK